MSRNEQLPMNVLLYLYNITLQDMIEQNITKEIKEIKNARKKSSLIGDKTYQILGNGNTNNYIPHLLFQSLSDKKLLISNYTKTVF